MLWHEFCAVRRIGGSNDDQARRDLVKKLNTRDPEKARDFYSKVMGWTPFVASMTEMQRPAESGEKSSTVFLMGETPICGLFDLSTLDFGNEIPAHWMT